MKKSSGIEPQLSQILNELVILWTRYTNQEDGKHHSCHVEDILEAIQLTRDHVDVERLLLHWDELSRLLSVLFSISTTVSSVLNY